MKVLKFGGTSVGTIDSLRNVKAIAESLTEPAVIVVSALGGLTDKLIATAGKASRGDHTFRDDMEGISARHHAIIDGVIAPERRDGVRAQVQELLDELSRNFEGVALLGDLPEKTLDVIVSFGERMSSLIVAAMVEGARHYDSPSFIKTEKWFNRNIADSRLTDSLIKETFADAPAVAVCGGFISRDRDTGDITNLGRGGSDYTAALIAASLSASLLEIWTDVDGFMTADPRVVGDARVLDHMSFVESMELCSFGAKVIYPPTIYPVFHKNIPIKILNTFNPQAPGTLIDDNPQTSASDLSLAGVSAVKSTTLIGIRGQMTGNVPKINSRTFNAMAKQGVSVLLVSPPADEAGFSFAIGSADRDRALAGLREEFGPEIDAGELEEAVATDGLATVAVVGENIGRTPGIGARVVHTLSRGGIEVLAAAEAASTTTVSCVVEETRVNEALRLLHSVFFHAPDDPGKSAK